MADKQRFCMRCAKLGVRRASDTEEIWDCADHGTIYKAALPSKVTDKPAVPSPAAGAAKPAAVAIAAAGTPRRL